MGILNKISDFVTTKEYDDEEYEEVETNEEVEAISRYETKKAPINTNMKETTMVLFEPRAFEESKEIAEHLKSRRAAVVNLHRLQRDYAQRTLDFLTGVVTALDGSIQKIGHNVVLCTPKNVGVDGRIDLDSDD